jgi:hypothetical protein
MGILDVLLSSAGSGAVKQVGQQLGIDDSALHSVLAQIVPALTGGIAQNAARSGGLDALRSALQGGDHARYLDDPSSLKAESAVLDGNKILGHLLGSKDASRSVAGQVSAATGIDPNLIKKLLPVIAAATMGALSKETASGKKLESSGASGVDLLSSLIGSGAGSGNALGTLLSLGKKLF